MTGTEDRLAVLLGGRLAGTVRAGREGACWFSYAPEYAADRQAVPLSLTIPVEAGERDIADWMDGLLPARLEAREFWAERFQAESSDPMGLLATPIGWDCAGAVQFCPHSRLDEMAARTASVAEMDESGLARHLEQIRLGMPPAAPGVPMAPFSLAGAQAKTVLRKTPGGWAVPVGGAPSTHILKIALPGYPDTDLVEHICMDALRRAGIPAARTEIVSAGTQRAIAVERYDRRAGPGGQIERVHQEDLCQALGFPSLYKFERNGGPAVADIAKLLASADGPPSLRRFFDALACNWLLAGDDAHAKNYSILIGAGEAVLAPLYDVCSKAPWIPDEIGTGGITLAMQTGTAWSVAEADLPEPWRDCAAEAGIDPDQAAERVAGLAARLPYALAAAVAALPPDHAESPAVASLAALAEPRPAHTWGRYSGWEPPQTRPAAAGPGPPSPPIAAPRPSVRKRRTRCPHIGRRSRRRCNRPYRHPGPHTYDQR